MKNLILYIAILIALQACTSTSNKVAEPDKISVTEAPNVPIEAKIDRKVSDPVFFMETGTSFGLYMQALYKLGKFDDMIKLTSSKTLSKFGKENVLEFYKNMPFAYKMKLNSYNVTGDSILNYEAGIMATRSMIRIKITIEHDTCKIVLKDLKKI